MILLVFMLVPILVFVAFTVDMGYISLVQAELQSAADAAAMAGALELSNGPRAARDAAVVMAANNPAAQQPVTLDVGADIALGNWDEDTATFTPLPENDEGGADTVRVICRRNEARGNQLELFFARIIGQPSVDLWAAATAKRNPGSCGGIIGLNRVYLRVEMYTDSYNSNAGPYNAAAAGNNGDVCSNGHIRLIGSAGINGDAHSGPNEAGVEMGMSNYVTGNQSLLPAVIDYPPVELGNVPFDNNNGSIPFSHNGIDPLVNGNQFVLGNAGGNGKKPKKGAPVPPVVPGDVVDLAPGTYYFDGLVLAEGGIINVVGLTKIYINGDVDMQGGGIVNQTLIPKNLQIYPLGALCLLPDDIDLHAAIYTTVSAIEKKGGSGGFFGKIVGQKVKISGTGGIHVDDAIYFEDLAGGGTEIGGQQIRSGVSLVD